MGRECRKCGHLIPYKIKIDGKEHNLKNRKFCIDCSPFMRRNTSSIDPIVRKSRQWKHYSEKQKNSVKLNLYYRALTIRDELYAKFNYCCGICGYNKCKRALSFHHRDPSIKLFGLTLNNLWSKKRYIIDAEADKCDLLCLNCHQELEDKIARKTNIVEQVNLKYGTNF